MNVFIVRSRAGLSLLATSHNDKAQKAGKSQFQTKFFREKQLTG